MNCLAMSNYVSGFLSSGRAYQLGLALLLAVAPCASAQNHLEVLWSYDTGG
jgi:hypothetical protein